MTQTSGSAGLPGAFFDPADLFQQRGLHFRGLAFPSRDTANVGRVDSQLSSDPAVDASIEAESIESRIFAIIHVMIRDPLSWSAWRDARHTEPSNRGAQFFWGVTPVLLSIASVLQPVKE